MVRKQVSDIHDAGGDWMRESARQITSFGFAGAAGVVVGSSAISAGTALAVPSGLVIAGPIGWAVLGVIVATGLIAGFTAGYASDKVGRAFANKIMEGR